MKIDDYGIFQNIFREINDDNNQILNSEISSLLDIFVHLERLFSQANGSYLKEQALKHKKLVEKSIWTGVTVQKCAPRDIKKCTELNPGSILDSERISFSETNSVED